MSRIATEEHGAGQVKVFRTLLEDPLMDQLPTAGFIVNKSDLYESERELVALMHDLGFGRVEDLTVRDGKPVLNPPPRVIAMLTMRAQTRGRHEADLTDFSLKQSVVLLLVLIRQIRNGKILLIHVRHGLPISVEVDGIVVRAGALNSDE